MQQTHFWYFVFSWDWLALSHFGGAASRKGNHAQLSVVVLGLFRQVCVSRDGVIVMMMLSEVGQRPLRVSINIKFQRNNNTRNLRTIFVYLHTHIYSRIERNSPRKAVWERHNSQAMPFSSLNSKDHQEKEPSREAREASMGIGLEICLLFRSSFVLMLKAG